MNLNSSQDPAIIINKPYSADWNINKKSVPPSELQIISSASQHKY